MIVITWLIVTRKFCATIGHFQFYKVCRFFVLILAENLSEMFEEVPKSIYHLKLIINKIILKQIDDQIYELIRIMI